MTAAKPFLTAEWRSLLMLNYEVDPAVLRPRVPRGVELDSWNGRTYVSVVGFLFLNTRLKGIPIPFHRNFEEVNLRFYVRRKEDAGGGPAAWRRGVVFIKELVPRFALAAVARAVYNENYTALPMRHQLSRESARYSWRFGGEWNHLRANLSGNPAPIGKDSEEEFITEHYWGYAAQRDGGAVEYQVEHVPWRVTPAVDAQLECDAGALYGSEFAEGLNRKPASAFLAEGSPVVVYSGRRL